jgi:cytochrome c oxidase cbb3-type subunit 3
VIAETITQGRAGVMPAFKGILTDAEIHLASAYVYGLTHRPAAAPAAAPASK